MGAEQARNIVIPGSSDSKIISINDIGNSEGSEAILRLRLDFLLQILFGKRLLIPEGWSLDSVPFLVVGGEIVGALNELSRDTRFSANLNVGSPIVFENRGHSGYIETFVDYLFRGDVHWSGYTMFQDNIEFQADLANKLRIADRSPRVDRDRIATIFEPYIGSKIVSENIGLLAEYLGASSETRTIQAAPPPDVFSRKFQEVTNYLANEASWDPRHLETARPMIAFAKSLLNSGEPLTSSSPVMERAKRELEADHRAAIFRLVNFAYMHVTAYSAPHASVSSAPLSLEASPQLHLADQMSRNLSVHSARMGVLDFEIGKLPDHDLISRLRQTDWHELWLSAIRLANNPHWHAAVRDVGNRYNLNGLRGKELSVSKEYCAMNRILAAETKDLVIHSIDGDRFGLSLSERWLEGISGTLGNIAKYTAIGTSAAALATVWLEGNRLFGFNIPLSAGTAAAITAVYSNSAEEFAKIAAEKVKQGVLAASTSTVIDVLRKAK
jgi:hypothetical protein